MDCEASRNEGQVELAGWLKLMWGYSFTRQLGSSWEKLVVGSLVRVEPTCRREALSKVQNTISDMTRASAVC